MTVFEVTDVTDWFAGETAEQVKEAARTYFLETGMSVDEVDECLYETPIALTDEQMGLFRFCDGDDVWTFVEQLRLMMERGETFPCFFASTEF